MNKNFNGKMLMKELWGKGLDSSDKILMDEIMSLCKQPGGCYAGDEHFSELLEESSRNVNRRIQKLKEQGRIFITTIRNGKKNKRYIKYISLSASAKSLLPNPEIGTEELSFSGSIIERDNLVNIDRQDVSGIIHKEHPRSGIVSNPRNEVEVRHDMGQKKLAQEKLDQENTSKENLQIVPHPSLRYGGVRDNKEDHQITTSTEDPILSANSNSSIEVPKKSISNFGSEDDEIEFDDTDIESFRVAMDDFYKDDLPMWYTLLKNKHLFEFVKETSHIHKGIPEIIEMLTVLKNDLKKRSQGR